jgi:hypothetical protein
MGNKSCKTVINSQSDIEYILNNRYHNLGHSCPVSMYGINSGRNPELFQKESDSDLRPAGMTAL